MEEKIGKNLYVFLSKCLLSDVWNISISNWYTLMKKKLTDKFKDSPLLRGGQRNWKGGGARFEEWCDNRNEARRAEFAQGWGPGEGMCPSIG